MLMGRTQNLHRLPGVGKLTMFQATIPSPKVKVVLENEKQRDKKQSVERFIVKT